MNDAPIPRWLGVCLLLLITTMFGSNHVAARVAFEHGTNVTTAVAFRATGTALAVLLLLLANRVKLNAGGITIGRAAVVGLFLSAQSYCLYSAVARIPVALALLAFQTFPIALALISWAAGAERPARRTLLAMPIVMAGLAFALDAWGLAGSGASGAAGRWSEIGGGVAWATAGSLSFACVLFLTTRWLGAVDGRLRSFYIMSVVALVMVGGGAASDGFALPADATGWIAIALLTVLYGTAITSLFVLLPRLGAVNNAVVLNFEPIAVLGIAWAVLGQVVAPSQVVGAFVVVIAITISQTGRR